MAEFLSEKWLDELDRALRASEDVSALSPIVIEQVVVDVPGRGEVRYRVRVDGGGARVTQGAGPESPDVRLTTDYITAPPNLTYLPTDGSLVSLATLTLPAGSYVVSAKGVIEGIGRFAEVRCGLYGPSQLDILDIQDFSTVGGVQGVPLLGRFVTPNAASVSATLAPMDWPISVAFGTPIAFRKPPRNSAKTPL